MMTTGLKTESGPQSERHHDRIRANRNHAFDGSRQFDGLPGKVASCLYASWSPMLTSLTRIPPNDTDARILVEFRRGQDFISLPYSVPNLYG